MLFYLTNVLESCSSLSIETIVFGLLKIEYQICSRLILRYSITLLATATAHFNQFSLKKKSYIFTPLVPAQTYF